MCGLGRSTQIINYINAETRANETGDTSLVYSARRGRDATTAMVELIFKLLLLIRCKF